MFSTGKRKEGLQSVIMDRWLTALIVITIVPHLAGLVRVAIFGMSGISPDAAFYEHAGWYVTQGGIPYINFWDQKPPLPFEMTGVLALITGGNILAYHIVNVAATVLAGIGIVAIIGLITYQITKDEYASILAGVTLLLLPKFYYISAQGFKPKYFTIVFGLLSIYLLLEDRHMIAGAAAAASAAIWQLAIIFPAVTVITPLYRKDRRQLKQVIFGISAVFFVVVGPILLWGAANQMIAQAVFSGFLLGTHSSGLLFSILHVISKTGYATPYLLLGIYGLYRGRKIVQQHWWLVAGTFWFLIQVLFLDFENTLDLVGLLSFLGIGTGLYTSRIKDIRRRYILGGTVALLLVVNPFWAGALDIVLAPTTDADTSITPPLRDAVDTALQRRASINSLNRSDNPYGDEPINYLPRMLWNKEIPRYCHYRLTGNELRWLAILNGTIREERCGPYDFSRLIALM